MAHGSNQPPDASRACWQAASTSAMTGGGAVRGAPRRSRLSGLPGSQVLNTRSASRSTAQAAWSAARRSGPGSSPGCSANETTVPITGSAWVTRPSCFT